MLSGALGAVVHTAGSASDEETRRLDRARLERELETAEGRLVATRARLADPSFVGKAPAAIVDGARQQESELADLTDRLRARLDPGALLP